MKVVIYGGNGFVGSNVAKALTSDQAEVICLSRSGHKPIYLNDQQWSSQVRWCKGDAGAPDAELLSTADVVVCSVGSPPVPTFSRTAYQQQIQMNGTSCVNAITGATQAGVTTVILMGAQIPWPMRSKYFGYYVGKQMAFDAAQEFAGVSEDHTSVVLQPGMITGKRRLQNGKTVHLDTLTKPVSWMLPSQFVSVETVATRIASIVSNPAPYHGKFTVLKNNQI